MAANLQDIRPIDRDIRALLEARNEAAAYAALRKLFIEELDFGHASGSIALKDDGLPHQAVRLASRDGVHVVAVRLQEHGRVLIKHIRAALKEVKEHLGGDVLLVAGDADGGEWQLVWPTQMGGKDVLRRMVLIRNQPARTAVTQLAGVYAAAARSGLHGALDAAFDVEAVTRDFFREYKAVFDYALEQVQGFPDADERRLFCQVLFNRLMFIYFLQRKGWLRFGERTGDYLQALWKASQAEPGENFYDIRLKLLFFVSLSHPRGQQNDVARKLAEEKTGQVPFLNGGLFSEEDLDRRPDIHVPNEVIRRLIEDLFERFNFTITESTPYDVQVAVDPEILGKVFEELVTGRHETGSYYTPRPIVSFMCREALKGYLTTRVPDLSEAAAARYVDEQDPGAIDREQARAIREALEEITVVDPACGSGAYLLGMMQELLECQDLLDNQALLDTPADVYARKLRIIQRNVYGVDIDPFAVNIAMLRLWLSLVVDYEGAGDPPPLPNLDLKIVAGDSIAGPNPDVPPSNLIEDAVRRGAGELAETKARYAVARGEEKRHLRLEVEEHERSLAELMSHGDVPAGAVDWRVIFAEVFTRGGFDIVMANPPYVRMEAIKGQKPLLQDRYPRVYTGRADLYVYFYARALQLLRGQGMLVFISSNKWLRAAYGAKLRGLLAAQTAIWSITDFGDLPVFQSAAAYPMIFIAQSAHAPVSGRFTQVSSLDPPYPDVHALVQSHGMDLPTDAICGENWGLTQANTASWLQRMRQETVPLSQYVGGQIYYGVKTGLNEAFIIDGSTREALIAADPNSTEIIKPFIVGKDVRRWSVDYRDRWLIYAYHGIDMLRYPAVLEHLRDYQERLAARATAANHEWYELQQPQRAYSRSFALPKIVYPDIAKEPRFALDTTGAYSTNTTYLLPCGD